MLFLPLSLLDFVFFSSLLHYIPLALASPHTSPSSFVGHYVVLNATIEDTPASGKGPPESRPYEASTPQDSHRTIALNVSGTNPGALPVICKLPPWQPETGSSSLHGANSSLAEDSAKAVDLRFNCTDPEVIVQLQALPHLDYNWGFFIEVALNNVNPAAWMVRNLTAEAGWQWSTVNGSDIWRFDAGPLMIDSMPNQTLEDWNQFA